MKKEHMFNKVRIIFLIFIVPLAACNDFDSQYPSKESEPLVTNTSVIYSVVPKDDIVFPLLDSEVISKLVGYIEESDSISPISYESFIALSDIGRTVVKLNLNGRDAYYEFFYLGKSLDEIVLASHLVEFFGFWPVKPDLLPTLINRLFKPFEGWNL